MLSNKSFRYSSVLSYIVLSFFFSVLMLKADIVSAEETECIGCHEALSRGQTVHAAISMGCTSCHSAIDASRLPHKTTNRRPRGLSSRQPDFCYDCHDKSRFMKKTVHDALALGCTSCHNPHSSKDVKLLVSAQPELCFNCHDANRFSSGKNPAHMQAKGIACTTCHDPHSTDTPQLLTSSMSPESVALTK
ncbi:MAG: cytochrome c3 family protein [Nitrospirae bacterium]|nr:cytochrome c3 family protein [Nitrospirota bacterium]